MDRATIGYIGTAAVAVLGALASHGSDAIKALGGVPALLQAFASGLPLGLWSFVLAFSLATLVWIVSIRRLPVSACGKAPFGKSNLIALLVALAVTVSQQYVAPSRTAGALLNAVWIGLLAGLLAPQVGIVFRGKARSKPYGEPPK